MSPLMSEELISGLQPAERQMAPGAGLIIAGVASLLLWALIAAIVALA